MHKPFRASRPHPPTPNLSLLTWMAAMGAVFSLASCQLPPEGWREIPVAYDNEVLWTKPQLTWAVDLSSGAVPPGLSQEALLDTVDHCFQEWEQAGVFAFQPALSSEADIVIRFTNPPDGQFDGPLGKMTKGFYPWEANRGQIYLDPSERWTTAGGGLCANPLTDWLPHQIAHVLGLRDVPGAVGHLSTTGPQGLPDDWALYQLRKRYGANPGGAE